MQLQEFQETISSFLLYIRKEKNLSDNSYRAYAADVKQFALFWEREEQQAQKNYDLKEALSVFKNYLIKNKAQTATIARKLSCFNTYEHFMGQQDIVLNLKLARPHVPMVVPESLTQEEITFLLDEVPLEALPTQKPHRDKAILELFYATGIRCSELINIRLVDLNMHARTITITGKRKKTRLVYFSEKAQRQLELYIKKERKNTENSQEFFFLNYRYQPLTSRSIQRTCNMFSAFLKSKKVITPQLLRHSFAVHLLEQGADSKVVQQLLGFSSGASIEKYLL